MAAINLMPWREHKRLYDKQIERWILLGAAILASLLVLTVHIVMTYQANQAAVLINQLEEERQNLLEMQRMIREKKQHLSFTAPPTTTAAYRELMDNILLEWRGDNANATEVCFTEMQKQKGKLTCLGNASSALDLTNFLRGWPSASLFSEIKIESIEDKPEHHLARFRFAGMADNAEAL